MFHLYGRRLALTAVALTAAFLCSGAAATNAAGMPRLGAHVYTPGSSSYEPLAMPKGTVVYDSIQWVNRGTSSMPKYGVSSAAYSEGYDCCGISALGDAVIPAYSTGSRLKDVAVVFQSWACQSGSATDGSCMSAKGATYNWPITVSVYAAPSGSIMPGEPPGRLLVSSTVTKKIRYRPSASPKCDSPSGSSSYGTLGGFIDPITKYCTFGVADVEVFNMSVPRVTLPSQIVVAVGFNTSSYGASPVGATCAIAGCPYDSLNVQLLEPYPTPSSWMPSIGPGSVWDPNGLFVSFGNYYTNCIPGSPPPLNTLVLDDSGNPSNPCWPLQYHPQLEVTTF